MMSGRAVPQGTAFQNGIVMKGITEEYENRHLLAPSMKKVIFCRLTLAKEAVSLTETFLSFIMGECKDIGRQQSCILNGRKQRLGK